MKRKPLRTRNNVGLRWALVGLVVVLSTPLAAVAAERMVLGEYFTWLG